MVICLQTVVSFLGQPTFNAVGFVTYLNVVPFNDLNSWSCIYNRLWPVGLDDPENISQLLTEL